MAFGGRGVLNSGQNERKTVGEAKWNQKGAELSKKRGVYP